MKGDDEGASDDLGDERVGADVERVVEVVLVVLVAQTELIATILVEFGEERREGAGGGAGAGRAGEGFDGQGLERARVQGQEEENEKLVHGDCVTCRRERLLAVLTMVERLFGDPEDVHFRPESAISGVFLAQKINGSGSAAAVSRVGCCKK